MSEPETVGNFHVVSLSGRTATFLTTKGLPDTAKALAWARRNVTPEGGCSYAVVQVTKRISVDFKPRLVEAEGLQEIGSSDPVGDVALNHPDGTPKKLLTEADVKADLAGTPRPDNDDHPDAVGAKPKGSYKPTPPPAPPVEAAAEEAPPVEAPKPAPKALPKPPPAKPVSVPLTGSLAAPVPAAAPKAAPSAPKPPPPPPRPVAAPKPPAPVAAPAGSGGLDDLDLA